MARIEKNYTIVQGNDWRIDFTVIDEDGSAVDLTGSSHKALIKSNIDDADSAAVAEITVTLTDAANGEVALTLSETDTAAIAEGDYYWDMRVKTSGGWEDTPIGGILHVVKGITQAI